MSRIADEHKYNKERKFPGKPGAQKGDAAGGVVSFHPTVKQKAHMEALAYNLEKALPQIADCLERGARLTFGWSEVRHAFFVMARDGRVDWNEGVALSVFHGDLERLLVGLGYYVGEVNPDYPEVNPGALQFEFDW